MGFSVQLPVPGQPFSTEGVKVGNDIAAIASWGNGHILGTDLDSNAGIVLSQLAQSFLQTPPGAYKVVFGTVVLSWTASAVSAVATVNHGLGTTPLVAFVQCHDTGSPSIAPPASLAGVGSAQFSVVGVSQTSGTFTIPYYWLAIG